MKRAQWIALGVLFVFAALVLLLVLRNPQAPPMPPDADHVWQGPDACLTCHGPEGEMPRNPNHPVGRDCLRCHSVGR